MLVRRGLGGNHYRQTDPATGRGITIAPPLIPPPAARHDCTPSHRAATTGIQRLLNVLPHCLITKQHGDAVSWTNSQFAHQTDEMNIGGHYDPRKMPIPARTFEPELFTLKSSCLIFEFPTHSP
jgi:hypothetical protein